MPVGDQRTGTRSATCTILQTRRWLLVALRRDSTLVVSAANTDAPGRRHTTTVHRPLTLSRHRTSACVRVCARLRACVGVCVRTFLVCYLAFNNLSVISRRWMIVA